MKETGISAVVALALALLSSPATAEAASPVGVWINDTGRGAVEIKNCGGGLCGHVVWVKSNADNKGCGKQILGEVKSQGGGRWDRGWIYSPEKKQRYDVELTPLGDGRLRVVGYAGTKFFSKTMIWTKAPADLKRCGDTVAVKAPTPKPAPSPAPAIDLPAAAAQPAPATAPAKAPPAAVAKDQQSLETTAKVSSEASLARTETQPSATTAKPAPSVVAPTVVAPAEKPAGETAAAPSAPVASDGKGAGESEPQSQDVATDTGSDSDSDTDDDDPANAPKASGGKLQLGDIDLETVLKRTNDGKCKLDLPWVKVKFDCDR